jgi:7-methyl-GTP pyrophosphatase
MHPILLASSSVYRRELLSRLKLPFECYSTDIDESPRPQETIPDLVLRLSHEKAHNAATQYPQHVCIGSDEVAALDGVILGKPGTHENAIEQLTMMSNREVVFYTGVCVLAPLSASNDCRLALTTVKFRHLTPKMIENYLNKEKPYQSAASFKSETLGSALIEHFQSDDPTAIIGLPLIMLCDMLSKVGIEII